MGKDNWSTYNPVQAKQVVSGLQVLLDKSLLDEDDQKAAKSAQRKLSYRSESDTGTFLVLLNDEEHELVEQVEAALWR